MASRSSKTPVTSEAANKAPKRAARASGQDAKRATKTAGINASPQKAGEKDKRPAKKVAKKATKPAAVKTPAKKVAVKRAPKKAATRKTRKTSAADVVIIVSSVLQAIASTIITWPVAVSAAGAIADRALPIFEGVCGALNMRFIERNIPHSWGAEHWPRNHVLEVTRRLVNLPALIESVLAKFGDDYVPVADKETVEWIARAILQDTSTATYRTVVEVPFKRQRLERMLPPGKRGGRGVVPRGRM